eukprot:scaffold8347_cov62-Phaeocystis_antarctica.AAC.7
MSLCAHFFTVERGRAREVLALRCAVHGGRGRVGAPTGGRGQGDAATRPDSAVLSVLPRL